MSWASSDEILVELLRALKVAQPALFFVPMDEDRDAVPAICEALNLQKRDGIVGRHDVIMCQTRIGRLLDRYDMLIPSNFLHLLPHPLPFLLFQSTGRSSQSFFPYHKHQHVHLHHSLPTSPLVLCNDFSTSLSLERRQILLGRGALCSLLAKRLICFQNAVAVDSALHRAWHILLRGISSVLHDAQTTFLRGISWLSMRSFYVRVHCIAPYFKRMAVAMLKVKPSDSIADVIRKAIDSIMPEMEAIKLGDLQLKCMQRAVGSLDHSKRVCDYGFMQPHTTLTLDWRCPLRGSSD
jgi:hypothetical protein